MLPAVSTDFRTQPKYSKRIYFAFKPAWWAMHYWDELVADKHIPQYSFGFSTLTQYPWSAGTDNPISGVVAREAVNDADLATKRAGAGNANYKSTTPGTYFSFATDGSSIRYLRRGLNFFDTSALTSGATISDTVGSVYSSGNENTISGGDPALHMAQGNAASTTALANSDYAQANHGTTSFGSIAYASFSTGGYKDITFNASGIAAVSKTGVTKISLQNNWDINNNFTGTPAASVYNAMYWYLADETGTTKDPKIVVTYTTSTAYTKEFTEVISLVQTQAKKPSKVLSDAIVLVDTQDIAVTFARAFVDTVTLVETKILNAGKLLTEVLNLSEVFTKAGAFIKSLTETVVLVETFNKTFIYTKVFDEVITLVDTAQRTTTKVLTEVVALVETMATQATLYRALLETIVLDEVITPVKQVVRSFTETITLSDTYARLTGKAITEVVTLVETFSKTLMAVKSLVEEIVLVDTISVVKQAVRSFTETITLAETQLRQIGKALTETITLADVKSIVTNYARTLTETITLVASLASLKTQFKTLTETITLVDSIVRATAKVLTETITATLRFLGLHNGKDISYRSKYENRSGEHRNKYLDF